MERIEARRRERERESYRGQLAIAALSALHCGGAQYSILFNASEQLCVIVVSVKKLQSRDHTPQAKRCTVRADNNCPHYHLDSTLTLSQQRTRDDLRPAQNHTTHENDTLAGRRT